MFQLECVMILTVVKVSPMGTTSPGRFRSQVAMSNSPRAAACWREGNLRPSFWEIWRLKCKVFLLQQDAETHAEKRSCNPGYESDMSNLMLITCKLEKNMLLSHSWFMVVQTPLIHWQLRSDWTVSKEPKWSFSMLLRMLKSYCLGPGYLNFCSWALLGTIHPTSWDMISAAEKRLRVVVALVAIDGVGHGQTALNVLDLGSIEKGGILNQLHGQFHGDFIGISKT